MSFTEFQLHHKIMAGVTACGYTEPTPIQHQAIPPVLEGRDLIGLAQTGTGKTAAFVLPILQRLMTGPRGRVRALIVAPTRELAEQTHENFQKLGQRTGLRSVAIYGGVSKLGQQRKIKAGVEIVVACPGRLLDVLGDRTFTLAQVEVLVLDEADHMFDMGFLPAIRQILDLVPARRQTLLFSATMPDAIRLLAKDILVDPATIQIDHERLPESISHVIFPIEQGRKTALLKTIFAQTEMASTLIFTKTRYRAENLAQQLQDAGLSATSIQGNLSQQKRQQALEGFKRGRYKVLVATDIAARGIDVTGITHVINFDVPDTPEAYTHRIGRTGRADRTGEAFTFAGRDDRRIIQVIELTLGKKMERQIMPGFEMQPAPERRTDAGSSPKPKPRKGLYPRREDGQPARTGSRRPASGPPRADRRPSSSFGFDARPLASHRRDTKGRRAPSPTR